MSTLEDILPKLSMNDDESEARDSAPLTFSDMPIDVLDAILGELDLVNKLKMLRVCKSWKYIIQNHNYAVNLFEISNDQYDTITIADDKKMLQYREVEGYDFITINFNQGEKYGKVKEFRGKFMKYALHDLEIILGNPNFKTNILKVGLEEYWDEHMFTDMASGIRSVFRKLLEKRGIKIHAKELHYEGNLYESIHPILECLKPKILEKLNISVYDFDLKLASRMEFWKNLKEADIKSFRDFKPEDAEFFSHMMKFRVEIIKLTKPILNKFLEVLSKSKTFQSCQLEASSTDQYLNEFKIKKERFWKPLNYRRSIRESDEYFAITFRYGEIEVVKKKK